MINLVPQSAKKSVKLEYTLRVIIVGAILACILMAITCMVALPQIVLLRTQHATITESHTVSLQTNHSIDAQVATINAANEKVEMIADVYDIAPLTSYFRTIKQYETSDIVFAAITINRDDLTAPKTLAVSGEASTRQALARFKDRLESDDSIARVDLPLENLAKDTDVPFTITVHVTSTDSTL